MAEKVGEVKDLKVGSYVMIDGEPCKVVKVTKSKPGKHGSTKARVEAAGIFDGKKRTLLKPTSASCKIPIILKKGAQVVSMTGNVAQLMDLSDYSMFECSIPEDLKDRVQPGKEVEYWEIGDRKMIKQVK
ncbi:MAG: translation initiation factor IF-5A [Candidatus Aenigmarchaeota archaeon]|nr:translation initiation factor IF-5A [Candidatus Aenigmarchaeota archaeon]NIQ17271.1 translation initiation factor IF-5A [Candidatus Aenigmarchaeota archaeon]NIS73132.1 translation initiation factor IF-5A [Candidatus Aenigmarchaeota archaeon]